MDTAKAKTEMIRAAQKHMRLGAKMADAAARLEPGQKAILLGPEVSYEIIAVKTEDRKSGNDITHAIVDEFYYNV